MRSNSLRQARWWGDWLSKAYTRQLASMKTAAPERRLSKVTGPPLSLVRVVQPAVELFAVARPRNFHVLDHARPAGRMDRDEDGRSLDQRQLARQLEGALFVNGLDLQPFHRPPSPM